MKGVPMLPYLPLPEFDHERIKMTIGSRSGLYMVVALHSSALGEAIGGTRLWHYPHWSDALGDALRLSSTMTVKNALANLNAGGGKAVIRLEPEQLLTQDQRRAALLDLADLVESFDGLYCTAEDMGTTETDMLIVGSRTSYVAGLPDAMGGSGGPAGPTTRGVYSALQVLNWHLFKSRSFSKKAVTISGLGQVGLRLAEILKRRWARLTVTDLDPAKKAIAKDLGAKWVEPGTEHLVPATFFIPAGAAGTLTAEVIDAMDVRAICGPANNPLADYSCAQHLADRGILYAPDFIVNAGGVIYLDLVAKKSGTLAQIQERVEGVGQTLRETLVLAQEQGITPLVAAKVLAQKRINAAKARQYA